MASAHSVIHSDEDGNPERCSRLDQKLLLMPCLSSWVCKKLLSIIALHTYNDFVSRVLLIALASRGHDFGQLAFFWRCCMSGIKLYGRLRIRVGDTTTHGGVVVSGSPTLKEDGIPIARKGDKVTCPRCEPHMFVIAEGLANCLDRGIPVAVEGHVTTCGAKLIASSCS
jgi:uncharacterized Zn-binding protein involved in type VI secretion